MTQNVVKKALSSVERFISKQTGCLHYYHASKTKDNGAVPFYENFLLVLALFRSGEVESIKKGRLLCERLLAFECGGFASYMHLYPIVDKRKTARILLVSSILTKRHALAVGDSLVKKLDVFITKNLHLIEEEIVLKTIEILYFDKPYDVHKQFMDYQPKDSYGWGVLLLCFSLVQPTRDQQKAMLNRVESIWDFSNGVYTGVYANEKYEGLYRKPTLLDYILEPYSKRCLSRKESFSPIELLAALAYPIFDKVSIPTASDCMSVIHGGEHCLSNAYQDQLLMHFHDDMPFELLFLMKNQAKITSRTSSALSFTVDASALTESTLLLYCSRIPNLQLRQEGKQATYFSFDWPLEFKTLHNLYRLHVNSRTGKVYGSFTLGNRPAQISRQNHDYLIRFRAEGSLKEVELTIEVQSLKQAESKETPIACSPLST